MPIGPYAESRRSLAAEQGFTPDDDELSALVDQVSMLLAGLDAVEGLPEPVCCQYSSALV